MKKIVKTTAIFLILAMLIFSLASCAPSIVGKWNYASQYGDITFDFKSNGTLVVEMKYSEEPTSVESSYKVKGDKIEVSYDGSSELIDFSITDNTLTFDGMTLTKVETK